MSMCFHIWETPTTCVVLLWLEIKISCLFSRYLQDMYYFLIINESSWGFLSLVYWPQLFHCFCNATETGDVTESFRRNNIIREEQSSIWAVLVCHSLPVMEADWELASEFPLSCCGSVVSAVTYFRRRAFRLTADVQPHSLWNLKTINI